MKKKLHILSILGIVILIGVSSLMNCQAAQKTWTGATDSAWTTASNWSPSGAPSSTDTVTIVTGSNPCHLTQNTTVNRITLTSGTLQLHGYTLTVNNHSTFNGGTVTGTATPALILRGTRTTFAGTTVNAAVETIGNRIELNGSTFNNRCYLEQTGGVTSNGTGGNTFNDTVTIANSGTANFNLATSTGDTYNALLKVYMTGTHDLVVSKKTSYFNGNIELNISSGEIYLGTTDGDSSYLATGKTISAGDSGITGGSVIFRKFVQQGSTAQTLTATSNGVLNFIDSKFEGGLSITAPVPLFKNNAFYGNVMVTKTTAISALSDGGNRFYGNVTIDNTSTQQVRFASTIRDKYYGNVSFICSSTGIIRPFYSDTTELHGNLSVTSNKVELDAGSGIVRFAGSNNQSITGNLTVKLKNPVVEKTGGAVILDTAVSVSGTLKLVSGNIHTTSTRLLTILAGSSVTGANNNSFVSGPVKKVGNTAFVFPVGKGNSYRAVEISAPTNASDAFTGEYFDQGQTLGSSMDTTIDYLSNCNYWNLSRNTGSSTPAIKLYFETTMCGILDSADLRIANWNGTKWKNLGNGGINGSVNSGKISNDSAVSVYGYFALSYKSTPWPIANIYTNDTLISEGDSILISAYAANGIISWQPSSSLSCSGCLDPVSRPELSTRYSLVVRDYKNRFAIDSLYIFLNYATPNQNLAPAVEWKYSDHLPYNPFTSDLQTEAQSGEEWWYSHTNSLNESDEFDGFICSGYATVVNTGWDENGNGCTNLEVDPNEFDCGELESAGHVKGRDVSILGKKTPDGREFLWLKNYCQGTFFHVIQTPDKGYLAVGITLATYDLFTHRHLPYQFDVNGSSSFTSCATATWGTTAVPARRFTYAVKVDFAGNLVWQGIYGMQDPGGFDQTPYRNMAWQVSRMNNGNYIMVGCASDPSFIWTANNCGKSIPAFGRMLACYWIIDESGKLIENNFLPGTNDAFDIMRSAAYAVHTFEHDGNGHKVVISGVYDVCSYGGTVCGFDYRRVFLMQFNENLTTGGIDILTPDWINMTNDYALQQGCGWNNNTWDLDTYIDNGANTQILFPVINECSTGCFGAPYNQGKAVVYVVSPYDGSKQASVDFGHIEAYDLKIGVTPTSDGGFAMVSSRRDAPALQPLQCTDNSGTHWINRYGYLSNAYVAKVNSNLDITWRTSFDLKTKPIAVTNSTDVKQQECLYTITQTPEGGYVIAGNNSYNFDDCYLVKLYNDCSILDYEVKYDNYLDMTSDDFKHTLQSNTTWNTSSNLIGSTIVPDGKTLTINNSAELKFADSRKIARYDGTQVITNLIVETGGRLDISDNARLTAFDDCDLTMWDGIEVHGNTAASQNPFSNQGYVELSGDATIEHARVGILAGRSERSDNGDIVPFNSTNLMNSEGGGVISMDGGNILNCLYGVWFDPYLFNHFNRSRIENSNFLTNRLTRDPYYYANIAASDYRRIPMRSFVVELMTRRIKLYNNRFETDNSVMNLQPDLLGTGLTAIDGSYDISQGNVFEGLYTGIDTRFALGSTTYFSLIAGNEFNSVFRGIYNQGGSWQNISDNRFNDIPAGGNYSGKNIQPFGIWMNFPQGFRAIGNEFAGIQNQYNRGAAVTHSGQFHARIFNGSFKDLMIGTQAEGLNNTLRIYCNGYKNHDYAWTVLKINGQGILPDQGTSCQDQAGNIFSDNTCSFGNECHIFSEVNFHYWGSIAMPGLTPLFFSNTKVTVQYCSDPPNCPIQRIALNDSTAGDYRREMEETTDSLTQLDMAYNLIDYYAEKDTLNSDTVLVNIFRFINDNNLNKHLAALYLSRQEIDSAEAVWNRISLTNAEDSAFYNLFGIYHELAKDDKSIFELTDEQAEQVQSIAEGYTAASHHAETILQLVKGQHFEHNLLDVPPQEERKAAPAKEKPAAAEQSGYLLKAIPNPTAGTTYAMYDLGEQTGQHELCIYSMQGAKLHCLLLKEPKGMMTVHHDNLPAGSYVLKIMNGTAVKAVTRLNVVK